jgi:ribonucleoside-diphosphate reductase alpha chain
MDELMGIEMKSVESSEIAKDRARRGGVPLQRFFTRPGIDPFSTVDWELRSALISGEDGHVVFEQRDVEVPRTWSQTATNVVVSKYFRGPLNDPRRETSVRQLLGRVVDTMTTWGRNQQYFVTDTEAETFKAELTWLLLNQMASFNSPVYFNVGIEAKPQCSACFILKVEDNMDSILSWYRNEGMIFKGGSGAGVNLSALRSCRERLSSGGTASGPLSFMRAADASAGVIKSGGKTRRAAKMVVLNVDHPDITKFITCKQDEEKKAWALIDAGYDSSLDGDAYGSVFFQNANNSVRVTDDFMRAVINDGEWQTRFVKSGGVAETYRARELLRMMAEAAWACGDPGMQFDTTINSWHTCPNSGRINASNPCSEYMHLDNSACNLASLNLLKFLDERGDLDVKAFRHAVDVLITAQDIVVDNSSYPTPEIAHNAHLFRELGLGYANLGAALMALGMPYDSDQGRSYAAAITALMNGEAYLQSARIAAALGSYEGYAANREPMLKVIERHRSAAREQLKPEFVPLDMMRAVREVWDEAARLGQSSGYRNSQATVIAPTGTIAFMMDCDTTGIEPDIALVKYKKLVGGGMLKIVNQTVPRALKRLGYDSREIQEIVEYLDENETIEGAPHLADAHLAVFDCAFKPRAGSRTIHYQGHLKMMGAVQPFISGAISKTVNMPAEVTIDEVAESYINAWKLGLKAVAVYRDGSKRTQPLNTGKSAARAAEERTPATIPSAPYDEFPHRRKLPDERKSITHKFDIAGHEGYITVGMYEDGTPGDIFVSMSKQGSTISGLMDTFATAISYALQYGVPLQFLVDKFAHMRFEPAGFTKNPQIPYAKSIVDYLFRWLASKFLDEQARNDVGVISPVLADQPETKSDGSPKLALVPPRSSDLTDGQGAGEPASRGQGYNAGEFVNRSLDGGSSMRQAFINQADAPPCPDCGCIMVRNGTCYKCMNCGTTSGCS